MDLVAVVLRLLDQMDAQVDSRWKLDAHILALGLLVKLVQDVLLRVFLGDGRLNLSFLGWVRGFSLLSGVGAPN
jgi:hypothetical protein